MENRGAKTAKTILKILGILLAIGAVCFVAVKIYKKFFKKEEPVLEGAADEVDALAEGSVEEAAEEIAAEENSFEVPAEAVIANADQMEA
jgi:hypothetical protein